MPGSLIYETSPGCDSGKHLSFIRVSGICPCHLRASRRDASKISTAERNLPFSTKHPRECPSVVLEIEAEVDYLTLDAMPVGGPVGQAPRKAGGAAPRDSMHWAARSESTLPQQGTVGMRGRASKSPTEREGRHEMYWVQKWVARDHLLL